MLIRRPGRNPEDSTRNGARTVLLAQSHPDRAWCERITVSDPADLLDLDLALLGGAAPGLGEAVTDPVTLVCAHGKRDQCCARLGRPIAAELNQRGVDVWECSHTGGHRFAPSMIILPSGYSYGRLDAEQSAQVVAGFPEGRVPLAGLRGRSCWDAAGQAAEVAVRESVSAGIGDLTVDCDGDVRTVRHRDGRRWRVETTTGELPPRATSCGGAPKPVRPTLVRSVVQL